jgi:hypothetical protein
MGEIIIGMIETPDTIPEWMFEVTTYLIPKKESSDPAEFRPITCMSNLYKVLTKVINKRLQIFCEMNGILSENQMGTARGSQGAKELALVNKNLSREYNNGLYMTWIDVKKAFDSIEHSYLLSALDKLGIPQFVTKFVKMALNKWHIDIIHNRNRVDIIKMKRGILQGDSLSPTLFVLCLEPLSRKLNYKFEKIKIKIKSEDNEYYSTNHLIFIDDLKLFSTNKDGLKEITNFTNNFLKNVGLEINIAKSATNTQECSEYAKVMGSEESYKYLGIMEDYKSTIKPENKLKIKRELLRRIELLCSTKLNAVNLFRGINEYAISTMNYYMGLVEFEPAEFQELDVEIRKILIKNKIHHKPACLERLYLKRKELGRGLENISDKSERVIMNMYGKIDTVSNGSLRKQMIIRSGKKQGTHFGTINDYLIEKYKQYENKIDIKILLVLQKDALIKRINEKTLHKKIMNAINVQNVDIKKRVQCG